MAATVANISGMYSDLNAAVKTSEWDKVLTASNRILQESPDEQKAFQCKTAALIHQGKFEDGLHHLKPGKSKFGAEQKFERAYCEYRLNRLNEALATLDGCETSRDQELRAQILYRLERYDQALSLYRALVRSCADDYGEERDANMSAAFAAKAMFGGGGDASGLEESGSDEDTRNLSRDTYDQLYNLACAQIGRGRYEEAAETLAEAEKACREALTDDDPEALMEELAPIQFQQAYLVQITGSPQQVQESRKTYQAIANAKLADSALLAVCANNLVCLNRDQNLFDSKKRIKFASADALRQKLTRRQRQAIAINQCLVFLHSNQGDLCKRTAESLLKAEPGSETAALILASQLAKERASASGGGGGGGSAAGSSGKAVEFLEELCSASPDLLQARLALAQLLAQAGATRRACKALKQLPPGLLYTDRLVSAVTRLYASVEDRDAAAEFLASARRHFKGGSQSDLERLKALLRMSARFEQFGGNHRQAAALYSELLALTPNDQRLIASLVHAYAQFDPPKAEETSRLLKDSPAFDSVAADLDADQLESSFAFGSKYATKRTTAAATTSGSPKTGDGAKKSGKQLVQSSSAAAASTTTTKAKAPGKKKGRLPKNYDPAGPAPDPERWLPRRERSYYRGKKKDKHRQMTRGPQGATAAAGDLDVRAKQVAAAESAAAAAAAGSGGEQQQQQQSTGGAAASPTASASGGGKAAGKPQAQQQAQAGSSSGGGQQQKKKKQNTRRW